MNWINQDQDISETLRSLFTTKLNEDILKTRHINGIELYKYVLKNIENLNKVVNSIGSNYLKDIFTEIKLNNKDYTELIIHLFIIKINIIFILLGNKYTADELLEAIKFVSSLLESKSTINEDIKNKEVVDDILSILFIVDFLSTSIFSKDDYSILKDKEFFEYIQNLYKESDSTKFKKSLVTVIISTDIIIKIIYLLNDAFKLNLNENYLIKLTDKSLIKLTKNNSRSYLFIKIIKLFNIEKILNKIDTDKETKFIIIENIYLFYFIIITNFENNNLFLKTHNKIFKS